MMVMVIVVIHLNHQRIFKERKKNYLNQVGQGQCIIPTLHHPPFNKQINKHIIHSDNK